MRRPKDKAINTGAQNVNVELTLPPPASCDGILGHPQQIYQCAGSLVCERRGLRVKESKTINRCEEG